MLCGRDGRAPGISNFKENMTAKNRSLLALSCLSVGLALNSSLSGAAAQSGDSFKIRADVDLVTVEVTALDKKGNPVRNLKKEDFQLYEDGKKQEILSIDEVNSAAEASPSGVNPISGATPHRGKTVLIVFADNLLRSDDIKTSRDSAERFVREHMRPQDLFAVAKFDVSMKILQSFTSDRKDVLEAIRHAAGVSVNSTRGLLNELWRALDRIDYSIAQIKGQKSILIYADPVPSENQLYPTDTQSLIPDFPAAPGSPKAASSSSSPSHSRVSGGGNMIPDSDIISNVVYYVVELKAPSANDWRIIGYTRDHAFNGNNDAELDKLDQKISNYYILGFNSSNPEHNGAIRKLEVKTKLSGLTLKYQPGYLDRRPVDVLANTSRKQPF